MSGYRPLVFPIIVSYILRMGKINLLKADYIGKVGQTYGVRQYGQGIVKATPFSHSPHNTAQTKAVRAFEKLNRFSSYVAKTFWRYLNLSDKKMYKHNAVAKWLGVTVESGTFKLENLVKVIPSNPSLRFGSVNIDFTSKKATVAIENSPLSPITTREDIFIALVTDNGTVKSGGAFSSISQTLELSWDYTDFVTISVVMFKSSVQQGKKIINGFCLYSQQGEYVIDGILYTSLMPLNVAPRYSNGIIIFDSADVSMVDNIMHFFNI